MKEGNSYKVMRGGSALNNKFSNNSDHRNGNNSAYNYGRSVGFRVVRDLENLDEKN